jgi:hypothetical protein
VPRGQSSAGSDFRKSSWHLIFGHGQCRSEAAGCKGGIRLAADGQGANCNGCSGIHAQDSTGRELALWPPNREQPKSARKPASQRYHKPIRDFQIELEVDLRKSQHSAHKDTKPPKIHA